MISNTVTAIQQLSTGANVAYPFPNKIFAASDLAITAIDLTGVTYAFTFTSGVIFQGPGVIATVSNIDVDTGCTVTLSAPLAANWTLDLRTNTAEVQQTSIKNQGQFLPDLHEEAVDRLTREIQDLYRKTYTFGIHGPDTEVVPWPALPPVATRKNTSLIFDANGNPGVGTVPTTLLTQALWDLFLAGTLQPIPNYKRTPAEIAAIVFPTNYAYAPYDVRRYGAVGDGVTDDTAAFNVAGSIRVAIAVPDTGATYVITSAVTGLFYAVGDPRLSTTYPNIGFLGQVGVVNDENNTGVVGSWEQLGSVLMIGDSITQGTGASTYVRSSAWAIGRSLMNATNEGMFADSGSGYHHMMQMSSFLTSPGVSQSGGTVVAAGTWASRLNLPVGASLNLTQREIKTCDVYYDGAASAGCTFAIKLNGATVATFVASGAGLRATGTTILKAQGNLTRLTDTIQIVPTVGTLQLCGVLELKYSDHNASRVFIAGQSGYGYQDYTSAAAMDEMAAYLVNPTLPAATLMIFNFGSNNLYNATRALSPAAMVVQMQALLAGMAARLSGSSVPSIQFAAAVPPRTNEAVFPLILSQYRYEDYVRAIIAWAKKGNVTLIRHDLSALSCGAYYADGLHPNDVGHTIWAQTTLKTLGVKFDKFFKSVDLTLDKYITNVRTDGVPTVNAPWASYDGTVNMQLRVHNCAGIVILSGFLRVNGSTNAIIGTLPAGFWPTGIDRYFIVPINAGLASFGFARITISAVNGQISINAVPASDVSFDGISYPIYKNIET